MTESERYLFDLQGFLVVPNALSPGEVTTLNEIMDAYIERDVPTDAHTHRFGQLLRWGGPYLDLIDHPRISPYLEELLGPQFRLDHEYADLIRKGKGPIGTTLHGGATPFSSPFYYHWNNGQMRNGLTVAAYNLRDVLPGDGGFAAVSGSHKSNIPFPDDWRELESLQSCVTPVTGKAGTAILFTEALTHGTLPWRGSGERRTLFYKFSPNALSWAASYYDPNDYAGLTDRQRAILEAPNARYRGRDAHRYGGGKK
jgi:hypothetical protein